jgi:putative nucleotidyltransferase with HDIG domain
MPAAQSEPSLDKPTRAATAPRLVRVAAVNPAASVAAALDAALKARAPGVHATTDLVVRLASRIGRELDLDKDAQSVLEVSARVRDVGMLALPDSVVLATWRLSPEDWALINTHPVLGAQLLEELELMAAAAPIVRGHHERWDGNGYPDGLSGDAIPMLSRVIATCDAFVGIASDRPHRRGMGAPAALDLVRQESGAQFDPSTVDALVSCLAADAGRSRPATEPAPPEVRAEVTPDREGAAGFKRAVVEFDVVPVMAPAVERLLSLLESDTTNGGELVTAIESDTGLTVAVLRLAQTVAGRSPIANVPDAVTALTATGIAEAVSSLPRAEFPWRTSELEVLMHSCLVHAQSVARAADRLARELELPNRDDIIVAALLHDIGKLGLQRAVRGYTNANDPKTSPEERVRLERHTWGMDHASVGGLLLRRWNLSEQIVSNVTRHHSAKEENDVATYVRLADMLSHHAQGHVVDRQKLLSLAQVCELPTQALREILFDLPHAGASSRRRAEPSPLSARQTDVLTLLGKGQHYKQIALELGVATSTVRSHIHHIYATLKVGDRAQAVLRATEMGWL